MLNYAANRLNLMMTGSFTGSIAQMLLGTGSSTLNVDIGSLMTPFDRQNVTSITFPSYRSSSWQFDWGVTDVSGTAALTEFGIIASGGGFTGSLWSRNVIPALVFDGTNELRITQTIEVYVSGV